MMHVCVPVLKRYDLLRRLLQSCESSSIVPECWVIDNGNSQRKMAEAIDGLRLYLHVYSPLRPLGIAESWNWFIDHVGEERFIVNDDIELAPDSLSRMAQESAAFVSCGFGFSCFLLRDACVRTVGRFDETISPGYAYFEDRDYYKRMGDAGLEDAVVDCGVRHMQSATPAAYTPMEMARHHQRFVIAQENFLRKWGQLPADLERQLA